MYKEYGNPLLLNSYFFCTRKVIILEHPTYVSDEKAHYSQ